MCWLLFSRRLLTASVCAPNKAVINSELWTAARGGGGGHCDESTLSCEFSVKGIKMQSFKFCSLW